MRKTIAVSVVIAVVCGTAVLLVAQSGGGEEVAAAATAAQPAAAESSATSAGALVLPVSTMPARVSDDELLDPANAVWRDAQLSPILLKATPPLYSTDPIVTGKPPRAAVAIVRAGAGIVRLSWEDATADLGARVNRYPDAGEDHIYEQHSEMIERFPDAACAMVPEARDPAVSYPSLMMGDKLSGMQLYYWSNGQPGQLLGAHGRETTGETAAEAQCQATRTDDGWAATFAIDNLTAGTPMCFAVWDGSQGDRDGLKFFSLWYEAGE